MRQREASADSSNDHVEKNETKINIAGAHPGKSERERRKKIKKTKSSCWCNPCRAKNVKHDLDSYYSIYFYFNLR